MNSIWFNSHTNTSTHTHTHTLMHVMVLPKGCCGSSPTRRDNRRLMEIRHAFNIANVACFCNCTPHSLIELANQSQAGMAGWMASFMDDAVQLLLTHSHTHTHVDASALDFYFQDLWYGFWHGYDAFFHRVPSDYWSCRRGAPKVGN